MVEVAFEGALCHLLQHSQPPLELLSSVNLTESDLLLCADGSNGEDAFPKVTAVSDLGFEEIANGGRFVGGFGGFLGKGEEEILLYDGKLKLPSLLPVPRVDNPL